MESGPPHALPFFSSRPGEPDDFGRVDLQNGLSAGIAENAGEFDRFGNEVENDVVERFAVGSHEEEEFVVACGVASEEPDGNATADALDGAGAMGFEGAGVHGAEPAFGVDDFAADNANAIDNGWIEGRLGWGRFLQNFDLADDFEHGILVRRQQGRGEGDVFEMKRRSFLSRETVFEGFDEKVELLAFLDFFDEHGNRFGEENALNAVLGKVPGSRPDALLQGSGDSGNGKAANERNDGNGADKPGEGFGSFGFPADEECVVGHDLNGDGFDSRARRVGIGIDEDVVAVDAETKGGDFFGEGLRRGAVFRLVLVAVPGAGQATVEKFSFGEGTVLMLADSGDGGNLVSLIPENRNALAAHGRAKGDVLLQVANFADRNITILEHFAVGFVIEVLLLPPRIKVQSRNQDDANPGQERKNGVRLALEHAEGNVNDEQGIGDIDAHVQGLPNRRGEIGQPEIVTRRRHDEEDEQGEEAEGLEGKTGDAGPGIGHENGDDRVDVRVAVVEQGGKDRVDQRKEEHGDAEMAPVVEKREPALVQPRHRPDDEDEVEQGDRSNSSRANEDDGRRFPGVQGESNANERDEKQDHRDDENDVMPLFERIPTDRLIGGAHCSACEGGSGSELFVAGSGRCMVA